jgi:hypothetical protein
MIFSLFILWLEARVAEVARSILGLRAAKVLVAPELERSPVGGGGGLYLSYPPNPIICLLQDEWISDITHLTGPLSAAAASTTTLPKLDDVWSSPCGHHFHSCHQPSRHQPSCHRPPSPHCYYFPSLQPSRSGIRCSKTSERVGPHTNWNRSGSSQCLERCCCSISKLL